MESWRQVWRGGFAPQMNERELRALLQALESDDPRLLQGVTTQPPPLLCVQDWVCEACCALGFAAWQGRDLTTVGEVEEAFAKACFEADQRLGEPAACRWFLNWFDDTPRDEMRRDLLAEVKREILRNDLAFFFSAGEEKPAEKWLDEPNPGFDGRTPHQVIADGGDKEIEAMLWRIESGVAT